MDNLRAVIKNLFCHISAEQILEEKICYNSIEKSTFEKLGNSYIKRYSNDELDNMFSYWKSEFEWKTSQLHLRKYKVIDFDTHNMNVFDALITFAFAVLIEENGEPLCQYMDMLRWRDMIVPMEEDLFITAYLAMKDILADRDRRIFFWKPVIGHNNNSLNRLVSRGVAENHSHLKGAAPVFHLTWINLMNNIDKSSFREALQKLDGDMLQKNVAYFSGFKEESLVTLWWQAALIRVGLFLSYKNDDENIIDYVYDNVKNINNLTDNICEIQSMINYARELSEFSDYDYAISEKWLRNNEKYHLNEILSGERYFMYKMFYDIYSFPNEYNRKYQLFYAYLVIKERLRGELIQSNYLVGFDNFRRFQDRKDVFVEGTKLEPVYIEMAVRDTILNQHIISLESRIAPKNSVKKLYDKICEYDKWSTQNCTEEQAALIKKRHFYVIHFIKEKEEDIDDRCTCRHSAKRLSVKKQANVIAKLREDAWSVGCRIRGIDASSAEILCRPEVFAQAYRFLKAHMPEDAYTNCGAVDYFNLRATYHVGEDFLDIVDGLRAIDEAIHFLNLKCGDRLGHALALGVDIEEWYEGKSNRILITKQGYLDNIVWLYSKLRKYNIQGYDDVKSYLEKKYDDLIFDVYNSNICDGDEFSFSKHSIQEYFSIQEYYDAWKLRSDDPDLYKSGKFNIESLALEEWDKYAINLSFPQNYKIRENPKIAYLYYMYHYNSEVRKKGNTVIEVRVNSAVIKAIIEVRHYLLEEIASIGLGIETNPSSNCLIGTFKRYDKHPIIKWYNNGLMKDEQIINKCPQIPVSINTDDQGVFATYIENEYAYLALALEKAKDENGKRLYKREFILEWLEKIRKMGIDQSFNIYTNDMLKC